ncbi:hypothetical protein M409DRAFT_55161 [Zasmidium cellare ATCC 36951]|uniref:RRM domain-containing protein n=1 Tax=Zasmidium cellare ATCC 36951 TaxID=1080233 RepID=A0A6A6CJF2_ZASCE|nr:uncharacterized protein M409DRAFT_55161 [Zasmidium cellare ATCC 36951]KAF2166318.1 hypothetical protein M409DRAFT_55161 [Zasmidium cellare ATCC 36951]
MSSGTLAFFDGLPLVTSDTIPVLRRFLLRKLGEESPSVDSKMYWPVDRHNMTLGIAVVRFATDVEAQEAIDNLEGRRTARFGSSAAFVQQPSLRKEDLTKKYSFVSWNAHSAVYCRLLNCGDFSTDLLQQMDAASEQLPMGCDCTPMPMPMARPMDLRSDGGHLDPSSTTSTSHHPIITNTIGTCHTLTAATSSAP